MGGFATFRFGLKAVTRTAYGRASSKDQNIPTNDAPAVGNLLKLLASCSILLASSNLMAQPAAPSFEGHQDLRSREPRFSALRFDWSCGKIERSLEFVLSYREVVIDDRGSSIVATWGISRVMRGNLPFYADEELSAFVSSLNAIQHIAGRCFDTEGEIRISGLVESSNVPLMRTFRIR